jgi:DNA ligase-1
MRLAGRPQVFAAAIYPIESAEFVPASCEANPHPKPVMHALFKNFADVCERVVATTRKNQKVEMVAAYFQTLAAEEAGLAARYFGGNVFAAWEYRTLQVGGNLLWRTVAELSGDEDQLAEAFQRYRDLGRAAEAVLSRRDENGGVLDLRQLAGAFESLAEARGPSAKGALLNTLFARSSAQEAKYLIKIMLGEMRIGLKESLVEEAIAKAYAASLEAVKRSVMLTGDTAETLLLASENRLQDVRMRLFHPIGFMLASPAADANEAFAEFPEAIVEDKYDGIRAQAHIESATGKVRIYSRTLDEISAAFPELVPALVTFQADAVLDGEVLAWSDGCARPFRELQKRLGRKYVSAALKLDVPVSYVVFDLLALNGELTIHLPLRERKKRLAELFAGRKVAEDSPPVSEWLDFSGGEARPLQDRLLLAPAHEATSSAHLEELFVAAQSRGNEGLMIKAADSEYSPGRRGKNWLKLKHELATLDVVVTAAEYGNGHRAQVLSDYTFAVRDGERLLNVGKAYTGLTDAEIARMTRWFEEHTLGQRGHVREVEPKIVIEVAFNAVMRSDRHNSGYALRFPRIVRLREDKLASEIDTLERVREIYDRQGGEIQAAS